MENILFIDIETDTHSGKILDFGATTSDGSEFHSKSRHGFIDFFQGFRTICGHNILNHDLKYLEKELALSKAERFIDTLYWSPLLFPKKPYHRLLKDDKWLRDELNNPLNDAKKARDLFNEEIAAFDKLSEHLKVIYYSLLKDNPLFKDFFKLLKYNTFDTHLAQYIRKIYEGKVCSAAKIEAIISKYPTESAYAIAQIDVMLADCTSITPPWVLKNFPKVESILTALKSRSCGLCTYCTSNLDPVKALKKWFRDDFEFRLYDNEPLQERAVQKAIDGKSLLAVFPTGGGKSITFQLPALMQGESEKGLTVVISPLQSLQKDQVDNLEEEYNITKAVRLDGSLDSIERYKNIEMVEDGGASLLYISPESLRSKSMEKLLLKRNVVRFVIDEAHCFSAWGQDFRSDYLYIAEFIKNIQEKKGNNRQIPVSCFTATAKQEVVEDIVKYFHDNLGLELETIVSTSSRKNLAYHALHAKDESDKNAKLRDLLNEFTCPTIIYVSRTYRATSLAKELTDSGYSAIAYHGKMDKKERIANQDLFVKGECNIIVATKAFGMGVDKKDVGLVIHYDISTSLEDYVQEAGRAGRDANLNAVCYALFNDDDINKHFAFLSQTKITQQEISQIWSAIKKLTNKRGQITASALEIAREAGWDDQKEDEIGTRVTTSINALEQASFLKRGQNMPKVFANSILVSNMLEASRIIEQSTKFDSEVQKEAARRVMSRLFKTRAKGGRDADDSNEHIDYIADREQLETEKVIRIVEKLKEESLLADVKDLYAFLHKDGGNQAKEVLGLHKSVERFLHKFLLQNEDELAAEHRFNIKEICSQMQGDNERLSISHLNRILNFYSIKRLVKRAKDEHRDYLLLKPYLAINELKEKCEKRIAIASFIIEYVYEKIPKVIKSDMDTKVEFSVLELKDAFNHRNQLLDLSADSIEIEDALYYLKRISALEIDGGFLVIYNKMSIARLEPDNKQRYKKEHYEKLDRYYENKKEQIHIIGEYLRLLSTDYDKALEFTHDYFVMEYSMFKLKYFRGRFDELRLNMTKRKYNEIFKLLSETQRKIIDNSKDRYLVVLAGPGSGKTMLLTHKIAAIYLQEDIKHEQILMLTFSRAAASEFKMRLLKLIGGAANHITIKTFHSYCFDVLGRVGDLEKSDGIVEEAAEKIQESAADRFKLTKAIMVIDEAQDMSQADYNLVRALMSANEGMKVIAVGDDDQNIYEWRKSSSRFLGQLAELEGATKYELVVNYRSCANLVALANSFCGKIRDRLKRQPLVSNRKQNGSIALIKRMSGNIEEPIVNAILDDKPNGSTCVVVATNRQASNILGLLTNVGLRARIIQDEKDVRLKNLVEIRAFLEFVERGQGATIDADTWSEAKFMLNKRFGNSSDYELCTTLLRNFETLNRNHLYKTELKQYIAESKIEDFITQGNTILVSTIHQTKGREFDNVYLALASCYDSDEEYRKVYVAITRAKEYLHVQYSGDLFDNVSAEGVVRGIDRTEYRKPRVLTLSLTLEDVYLDGFLYVQTKIDQLRSGQQLEVDGQGCHIGGVRVVSFSKKFKSELEKREQEGYGVSRASINHIIYWLPKDTKKEETREKERKIILPNIELIRTD